MPNPIFIIHLSHSHENHTLCGLGPNSMYGDTNFVGLYHVLDQALEIQDEYTEDEKCEICWRDLELKLLAYIGEDQ